MGFSESSFLQPVIFIVRIRLFLFSHVRLLSKMKGKNVSKIGNMDENPRSCLVKMSNTNQ